MKRDQVITIVSQIPEGFILFLKNRSKGPVLIGLEEIVQRQVGVGVGRGR